MSEMMIDAKRLNAGRLLVLALAVCATIAAFAPSAARAEEACNGCSPWLQMNTQVLPTHVRAGEQGEILVLAQNLGDAPLVGELTFTDKLPAGLSVRSGEESVGVLVGLSGPGYERFIGHFFCETTLHEVTCKISEAITAYFPVIPYTAVEVAIKVQVETGVQTGEQNFASLSGGNARGVSDAHSITVDSAPVPYGVEQYELRPENADGTLDTQAGSHPFQLTTTLALNETADPGKPPASAKDLRFNLPPGLIGNPMPFPQCPLSKFLTGAGAFLTGGENDCPADTVVGVANVTIFGPGEGLSKLGRITTSAPLISLPPSVGEPARFGFDILGADVYLDTSVRTGGDYGVTVTVPNITEVTTFMASRVTFWGVPGDPRHDGSRNWNCLKPGNGAEPKEQTPCTPLGRQSPPPLIELPTSCGGPLHTSVETDSYSEEEIFTAPFEVSIEDSIGRPLGMDGCNQLPFNPRIQVTPDGQAASTPTGLTVGIHVPQDVSLNGEGLGEADVKDTTVSMPAGVGLNPAGGDGLLSCSLSQIALESDTLPSCPEAAKVATLEIKTPLLPNPLTGAAYIAQQNQNPFSSLLAMYLVARDPISGVLVKIAGEVKSDPLTGQLTAYFPNTPQLPFEDLALHFFGGSRAPLGTPAYCGTYTTTAGIVPWSSSEPVDSSSNFQITSGPDGGACASPLPFAPELRAGSPNLQAAEFTPFTMTMSRNDGNQNLDAITLHMPPGLSGTLTGVELCPEAQANEGTCGPRSQIGETTISVGLGGNPYTVTGGRVYMTGPYEGAPFGLSIVNPAKAGPFDVEHDTSRPREFMPACDCVVVRAKVEVDPTTAALTITSDTTGPHRIPTILDGIPLQIKHINVTINRPNFVFNPTNCEKMAITGDLTSAEGATESLSAPFQVTNCATLQFKPQFSVSTSGHPSRVDGVGLDVKLKYPATSFDKQTNIAKVRVELPLQLPSRLTTLQKACPDTVFYRDPGSCPAASKVGEAIATTPIIPEPFKGPAYFVSHGGAKFPELIIALHGYALTVDLHGETFISKAGVTSTTFNTVPDVPIGSFELKLPAGPDSALAANGDICAQKLEMPTTFTAQNGAVIEQKTPISVGGCSPEIRVIRHSVAGKHATVVVRVPSAGTLVAGGGGVHRRVKRIGKAGTVTLTLRLSKSEQRFVARHRGRRLRVPIKLSFSPKRGGKLNATVAVLMK